MNLFVTVSVAFSLIDTRVKHDCIFDGFNDKITDNGVSQARIGWIVKSADMLDTSINLLRV